jgi:Ca-activated chloride channel family protein
MSFDAPNALYVLILLFVLFLISGKIKDYTHYFSDEMLEKILIGRDKKKINFVLLTLSFVFLVISLSKPIVQNKPVELPKESLDIIVAFDISKSMLSADVYPSRLQFAKNKFYTLLNEIKDEKLGVIGFSSSAFMVAPLTNDMATIKYLVQNLSNEFISAKGSESLEALKSTNELLTNAKKKALIVFSDGTDSTDFSKQINYAKENNIKVFVYAIGTQKGGVIEENGTVLKDNNGNIVVTRLNTNIKELALQSGGAYLEYSTNSEDIKLFLNVIKEEFETKKEQELIIEDNEEYFYIPLIFAIIFYILAISGFRRNRG